MPEEGRIENPLPGLALTRFNSPQESRQCFYDPMFALVVSGKKLSMIGGKSFSYGAGEAALVTLDLPGRLSDSGSFAEGALSLTFHTS